MGDSTLCIKLTKARNFPFCFMDYHKLDLGSCRGLQQLEQRLKWFVSKDFQNLT